MVQLEMHVLSVSTLVSCSLTFTSDYVLFPKSRLGCAVLETTALMCLTSTCTRPSVSLTVEVDLAWVQSECTFNTLTKVQYPVGGARGNIELL